MDLNIGVDFIEGFKFSKAPLIDLVPLSSDYGGCIYFRWTVGPAIVTPKAGVDSLHQRIRIFDVPFEKGSCHSDPTSGIGRFKSKFLPDGTNPMGPPEH
jgi:hypothetical protein